MSRGLVVLVVTVSVLTVSCSTEATGPRFCDGFPDYDIVATDLEGKTSTVIESSGADGYVEWSPDGSRIAFVSSRDGNCDIYVANPDGTDQRNITDSDANELYPSWSPDGTRLVYASDEAGGSDLFIIEVASGDREPLADTGLIHNYPSWSPDGRLVLFTGGAQPAGSDVVHDVYTIDVETGQVVEITVQGELLIGPEWQTSGSKISYVDTDSRLEIWVTNPDGVGGETFVDGGFHSWSPGDDRLVFDREVDDGDVDLLLINADGSDERILVDLDGIQAFPDWSPHGDVILFSSG